MLWLLCPGSLATIWEISLPSLYSCDPSRESEIFTRKELAELHLYPRLGYLVTVIVAVTIYLKEGLIWAHSKDIVHQSKEVVAVGF